MAEFHLPPPTPFLASPGEPAISWRRWYSGFKTYMTATNLDSDDVADGRKRAVLLHCLGIEGQRIFQSLGDCPTYKDVVDKLESHFGPRKSVILERHRFRQRGQRPGESISSYVATLNEHAAKCNFGTLTDEMIRDQLIEKTHTPRIRERLLMEPDTLTLHKATTLAEQIENALSDSHVIASDTMSLEPNPVKVKLEVKPKIQGINKRQYNRNRTQNNYRNRNRATQNKLSGCRNCGSNNHDTRHSDCPANRQECRNCHKIGHFARMCRSSATTKVKQVNTPNKDSDIEQVLIYTVSEVNSIDNSFKSCAVTINGIRLNLVLDLGAKVSILNEELYKQHFKAIPLLPTRQMLTSYNGGNILVIGGSTSSSAV
ncbi:uncharacterized protein LOC144344984 [Saccoglossus kowalevskii]